MTIWILAFVLIASGIGMGLRQGAIRAAISFVGIVVAVALAAPLGAVFRPLMARLGFGNEALIWLIAPVEAFVLVLILFKVAAFFVHRKVSLYYRYKVEDVRFKLFERLNSRLGVCIGVLNGAAYLLLVCFVIYNLSYWTMQIASSGDQGRAVKMVNRLGSDLESTGMDRAARSVAAMPENFYKVANLAGLIVQNPQLSGRLAQYPAFLSLAERDDFQQLAHNSDVVSLWTSRAPVGQLLAQPQVKAMLQNKVLINTVWATVTNNLDDLMTYLKTGQSPKYDPQKILGVWDFNVGVSLAMFREAHPKISETDMKIVRMMWFQNFTNTTFIAAADGQAFLKNLPNFKSQPPAQETWAGSWTADGTNYDVTLSSSGQNKAMTATFSGARLILQDDNALFFDHE